MRILFGKCCSSSAVSDDAPPRNTERKVKPKYNQAEKENSTGVAWNGPPIPVADGFGGDDKPHAKLHDAKKLNTVLSQHRRQLRGAVGQEAPKRGHLYDAQSHADALRKFRADQGRAQKLPLIPPEVPNAPAAAPRVHVYDEEKVGRNAGPLAKTIVVQRRPIITGVPAMVPGAAAPAGDQKGRRAVGPLLKTGVVPRHRPIITGVPAAAAPKAPAAAPVAAAAAKPSALQDFKPKEPQYRGPEVRVPELFEFFLEKHPKIKTQSAQNQAEEFGAWWLTNVFKNPDDVVNKKIFPSKADIPSREEAYRIVVQDILFIGTLVGLPGEAD
jgi:hypothetical protein